jgi:hypothetical protein
VDNVGAAHRELEQHGVRSFNPRPRWATWSRRSWTTPAAT